MNNRYSRSVQTKLETYPFMFTFNGEQFINTTTISERLRRKPHQLFMPHRTNFHMVYLFTEGEGTHTVDFQSLDVKPKHILFIREGQVHAFDAAETYDGRALIFTDNFFFRSAFDVDFIKNSLLFNGEDYTYFDTGSDFELLHSLFIQIYDELQNEKDDFQSEILHNLLKRIFLVSERKLSAQYALVDSDHSTRDLVHTFKRLVDLDYKSQRQVTYYADLLHVSPRVLQAATANVLGESPKDWIIKRVILEAKRLLAYESISVKEISVLLHFDDPTNFGKFFKHYVGTSPKEFRKQ